MAEFGEAWPFSDQPWKAGDMIDVTSLLHMGNKTLPVSNNSKYWQRQTPCVLSYRFPLDVVKMNTTACSTMHSSNSPGVLMWLADVRFPFVPLDCPQHDQAFENCHFGSIKRSANSFAWHRLNFTLRCLGSCYRRVENLSMTVVQYIPGGEVTWNSVPGTYRRGAKESQKGRKKRKEDSESSENEEEQCIDCGTQLKEMKQKLEKMSAQMDTLVGLVRDLSQRQQEMTYSNSRCIDLIGLPCEII